MNVASNAIAVYSYDEFGGTVGGSQPERYGWLGGAQRSSEALGGSILMGVRTYQPTLGRFNQVDPVTGGNANAYDYCSADPTNCTDTSGAVSCRRTGTWGPWWVNFRIIRFRCDFTHWEVTQFIKGVYLYGAVIGLGAAILGVATLFGCGPCGVFAAILGVVAAFEAVVGMTYDFLYGFCRKQRGVWITGYFVYSKRMPINVRAGLSGIGCR